MKSNTDQVSLSGQIIGLEVEIAKNKAWLHEKYEWKDKNLLNGGAWAEIAMNQSKLSDRLILLYDKQKKEFVKELADDHPDREYMQLVEHKVYPANKVYSMHRLAIS